MATTLPPVVGDAVSVPARTLRGDLGAHLVAHDFGLADDRETLRIDGTVEAIVRKDFYKLKIRAREQNLRAGGVGGALRTALSHLSTMRGACGHRSTHFGAGSRTHPMMLVSLKERVREPKSDCAGSQR